MTIVSILFAMLVSLNPALVADARDYNQIQVTPTSAVSWSIGHQPELITWINVE